MTLPDFEKYRGDLSEFKMSDADKDEIILALWNIMNHFIDLAFEEDPVQKWQNEKKAND